MSHIGTSMANKNNYMAE